jgi:CHAT domain-containing protein
LVSIYVTPTGSFVWAVKGGAQGGAQPGPEAMKFHYSPQSRTWLNERVKKLRDATDLTTGLSADRMRYDLKAAHELYQELLAPVASAWDKSDTLLVVANDTLGQIPFSLLTTEAVTLGRAENGLIGSQYRQVPWLARKVAVSYLPSVSALVTLRALQPGSANRAPFLGFGDPDFGQSATQVASATSRGMRNFEEKKVARWDESVLSADKAPPASALVEEAPELSPLPDTRDEILAIAKALSADPQKDTFFGKDANPVKVKSTDMRGRRIVAFATHGLVAGDLPGLDQPALALTPMKDKDLNSGLLKLDDILKLSLNADLVVLSACNTAAADGEGSEAVSGLGRGFFYAGAKSVLATHWPVETVSARQLVTHLFERYAQDNTMTRAKALQRAMLEVLDKEVALDASGKALNAYAHPAFWAPYALYGDPGR